MYIYICDIHIIIYIIICIYIYAYIYSIYHDQNMVCRVWASSPWCEYMLDIQYKCELVEKNSICCYTNLLMIGYRIGIRNQWKLLYITSPVI